ncbi:MAG: DUF2089 family protein [Wenzhouxiangella sp.]|nr:MAG: DUF2089 family protein [Wenzhouxiangella sp.]
MKKTPAACPACGGELAVTELTCLDCETRVSGHFRLPALLRLDPDAQAFVHAFILDSGSLKAMASRLNVSYPTVRNRLDDIIATLTEESES